MENKMRVGIIFGGKSGEHEISLMSATSILRAMDPDKYDTLLIGISKQGEWLLYDGPIDLIETGEWEKIARERKKEDPDTYRFSVVGTSSSLKERVDVLFPVLHGPFGEDGTIQGLFEMADIPYVGAGVLASSTGMDKVAAKKLFKQAGLPVSDFLMLLRKQIEENPADCMDQIEARLNYPVFVKPANLGSSVGITKARNRDQLLNALETAAKYDRKIIVEAFVNCREIECAVLGNEEPEASVVGEILPSNEFYDYQAKYLDDGKSKLCIPADIPEEKAEEIRRMAIEVYKAIDCAGLARVDFFLEKETMKVYVNEINTMPGFTKYSMYPLLWEATGLPYPKLIDRLIALALERYKDKKRNQIR